jgi:3-methyladenine DNA glycosylase AlkC
LSSYQKPTDYFGPELAVLLAEKIKAVDPLFDSRRFISQVKQDYVELSLTGRVELIADCLQDALPTSYKKAIKTLVAIMGEENPNQTGMFKEYYWLMPVGKFIEKYGLDDYETSINAISELTNRNTGEYAIRPFIKRYPEKVLAQKASWAQSENFHLRRLASEGLRPKLPWAQKLDLFIEKPKPVFEILSLMKAEPVKFVQKSIANNLTDYIKVNPDPTYKLLDTWKKSKNENTHWMVWYATRKHNLK